jgi:hypothetical protein
MRQLGYNHGNKNRKNINIETTNKYRVVVDSNVTSVWCPGNVSLVLLASSMHING